MIFKKNYSKEGGFTLVELLVVIAIISVLSSVVLSSLNSARMKSRDARRMADLREIRTALEMYYDANGYYPQSDCGWDCNGYRYSYSSASWNALQADLAPYIDRLSTDPLNTACAPWTNSCYSYAYGNVGRSTQRVQYDLTAQLEDTNSSHRCQIKNYKFYFDNQNWCPVYSNQVYEASIN